MKIIEKILTAAVIAIILGLLAALLTAMNAQYDTLEVLTPSDEQARFNMMIIIAIFNTCLQILAVSTLYIIYVWNIYKSIRENNLLSKLALLTTIIMVVHLAIGILNSVYIVKGSHSTFLVGFTEILQTFKYVVLALFLFMRRRNISDAITADSEI